jgi:hypothetical protein
MNIRVHQILEPNQSSVWGVCSMPQRRRNPPQPTMPKRSTAQFRHCDIAELNLTI